MIWWRCVTGYAALEISGVSPERILPALTERSIGFWNAEKPDDFTLRLFVPAHERAFAERLAESRGLECTTRQYRGLARVWELLKKRKALLVCALLCALLLGASRLFIWRIEIPACESVSESELRAALSECGVDVGSWWPSVSQDLLRNALLRRVPELRWATVNVRGSCAELIVREKREKPEVVNEAETADIVASVSGYVTDIFPLRGTAVVTEGNTVLAGDTLIAGRATGRFETHGAVRAIGDIRARCWVERSAAAPEVQTVKGKTGRSRTRWALIFGKRRINLYKGCSICPSGCAKITEETSARGASLPIRLLRESCVPYDTQEQTAAELREELEAALVSALEKQLGEDGEIRSLRFSESRADGILYVTVHAECERSIGETVPHVRTT